MFHKCSAIAEVAPLCQSHVTTIILVQRRWINHSCEFAASIFLLINLSLFYWSPADSKATPNPRQYSNLPARASPPCNPPAEHRKSSLNNRKAKPTRLTRGRERCQPQGEHRASSKELGTALGCSPEPEPGHQSSSEEAPPNPEAELHRSCWNILHSNTALSSPGRIPSVQRRNSTQRAPMPNPRWHSLVPLADPRGTSLQWWHHIVRLRIHTMCNPLVSRPGTWSRAPGRTMSSERQGSLSVEVVHLHRNLQRMLQCS
jgi:hypothetical protein